jgi:hypothetical protein
MARQRAVQSACWTAAYEGERFHSDSTVLRLWATRYSHILYRRPHSVCGCDIVVLQHREAAPIVASEEPHSYLVGVGSFPDQQTRCPKVPQPLIQGVTCGDFVRL